MLTGLPSLTFCGSGSGINYTYPCPCRRLSYVNLRSRCKHLMRRQTAGFGPEHLSAHSILRSIGVFHLKCSYVFGLASHFPQSSVKSLPTSKAQLESSSPRKVFLFPWLHFYTPSCASRPNRTISTQIILSSMHALPQPASTSSLRRGTRGLFILK